MCVPCLSSSSRAHGHIAIVRDPSSVDSTIGLVICRILSVTASLFSGLAFMATGAPIALTSTAIFAFLSLRLLFLDDLSDGFIPAARVHHTAYPAVVTHVPVPVPTPRRSYSTIPSSGFERAPVGRENREESSFSFLPSFSAPSSVFERAPVGRENPPTVYFSSTPAAPPRSTTPSAFARSPVLGGVEWPRLPHTADPFARAPVGRDEEEAPPADPFARAPVGRE